MVYNIDDRLLTQNGNFGIATSNPTEKLSVNGKIRAKEIRVEASRWPDYIFEEKYKLLPLTELEEYIKIRKHLPGIPSADDVQENGIEVGKMNNLLLKKVEELTLYLIEVKKEINGQKLQIERQNKEIQTLKQQAGL